MDTPELQNLLCGALAAQDLQGSREARLHARPRQQAPVRGNRHGSALEGDGVVGTGRDTVAAARAAIWAKDQLRSHPLALRIVTAQAGEWTTLQKHGGPETVSIVKGKSLDVEGVADRHGLVALWLRVRVVKGIVGSVGARVGREVNIPGLRRPVKWLLGRLASYLAGRRIPDLNSGLRVVQRRLVQRFDHLLPSGFSYTTSITLAALCSDALVHFHPIDYRARLGRSKIRAFHTFDFLILILRTVVFYNPLKVFLPIGAIFFLIGFAKMICDLFIGNFSDTVVMGILGAVIIWSVGLLADQISRPSLGMRTQ